MIRVAGKSLSSKLGKPPTDDSLAAISWMLRALAEMAGQVIEDKALTQAGKRNEMLRIADRMAKLRDPDRIFKAEQAAKNIQRQIDQPTRGPETVDAPSIEEADSVVVARRGRPPRRALR
jgi:hypothetical protein